MELNEYDQIIVVATDGVWHVMSSAEVIGFLIECIETKKMLEQESGENDIADALVQLCKAR